MGLVSWLVAGVVSGVLAGLLTRPRSAPARWVVAALVGACGAILAGLVATALGFGGLGVFDARSLGVAALGAVLLLLLWRLASWPGP